MADEEKKAPAAGDQAKGRRFPLPPKDPLKMKDMYVPFNTQLPAFNKPHYSAIKKEYKNMGIARGLMWRKGFPVTKIGKFAGTRSTVGIKKRKFVNIYETKRRENRAKYAQKHFRVSDKFVRDVVRETVGWAPYEKRIMELLRAGNPKKALKFARKRLGSHKRGKRKVATLEQYQLKEAKAAQAEAKRKREEEAKNLAKKQKKLEKERAAAAAKLAKTEGGAKKEDSKSPKPKKSKD